MATSNVQKKCIACLKDEVIYNCTHCQQSFCIDHAAEHQIELIQQWFNMKNEDLFKQIINPLIQQINQWEKNSLQLIQQVVGETRNIVNKQINEHLHNMGMRLFALTDDIKNLLHENNSNEIDFRQVENRLKNLGEHMNVRKYVRIEEDGTLIKKINVNIVSPQLFNIFIDTQWNPNAITIAAGNKRGQGLNQFYNPFGFDIDNDQTIYVADCSNCRIIEWKKGATTGRNVISESDQLNFPVDVLIDHHNDALIIADAGNRRVVRWPLRNGQSGQTIISNVKCLGLAMNKNGDLYVADDEKDEVRRWKIGDDHGILVAGGNGKGNLDNQFNQPSYIFVDDNESVYVSDWLNHRVMKWLKGAKEGIIVAGGHGKGNNLSQLAFPQGITVDRSETVFVADGENHRVMRWPKGSTEGEVVVSGTGQGNGINQLSHPIYLSFDEGKNLYVLDRGNDRVQKFAVIEKQKD